jgi:hypothetical protein
MTEENIFVERGQWLVNNVDTKLKYAFFRKHVMD